MYDPMTVCSPTSGVYVTEQLPVPSSVQLDPTKSPLSLPKITVPVGVEAPAPAVSVTVAVHVVVVITVLGEQLTVVLVVRMMAVVGVLPLLVA